MVKKKGLQRVSINISKIPTKEKKEHIFFLDRWVPFCTMCQCCKEQYSVYLISHLHQKIERICILSNTKANYRPHIPLHNFSKWIRNDNGNCCKKASKIELHARFMATKNPLQSFLAQPWNNNVHLPLPFFLLINKKFVLIDTVHWILLSALIKFWILSEKKKVLRKKNRTPWQHFFPRAVIQFTFFLFYQSFQLIWETETSALEFVTSWTLGMLSI